MFSASWRRPLLSTSKMFTRNLLPFKIYEFLDQQCKMGQVVVKIKVWKVLQNSLGTTTSSIFLGVFLGLFSINLQISSLNLSEFASYKCLLKSDDFFYSRNGFNSESSFLHFARVGVSGLCQKFCKISTFSPLNGLIYIYGGL